MLARGFSLTPSPVGCHQIKDTETKPKKKVMNQYFFTKKLGNGADSKVYLVEDKDTGSVYAAKVFDLSIKSGASSRLFHLEREIQILRNISHGNIIGLKEVLHAKADKKAALIMEYADCGSVENLIKKKVKLNEEDAAFIFKQVVDGLLYLHSHNYVHEDVKPSNILLFSDGTAKLSDFGTGHSFGSAGSIFGSPAYQAPEVMCESPEDMFNDPIKVDVWSLGVAMYESIFHKLPYSGNNIYEINHFINSSTTDIPEGVTESLRDLLSHMLVVDPQSRFTMEQVSKHAFFHTSPSPTYTPEKMSTHMNDSSPFTIKKMDAVVCEEGYSFSSLTASSSWPGARMRL